MTNKCEHGAERERHKEWPEGLAFTEPLHTCSCCGTLFYYIETWFGMYGEDEADDLEGGTVYEPKDRCEECGGHYRHEGATMEEMGWKTQCNDCKGWFPDSQLETHDCKPENEKMFPMFSDEDGSPQHWPDQKVL